MNSDLAHEIARQALRGECDRYGQPLIDHVERVASTVPEPARAVAYLHELLEHSDVPLTALTDRGLTVAEREAIVLLTRNGSESYEAHVLGVAHARGFGGALARTVKLADLDDHLLHRRELTHPPYGWARQHIVVCRDRYDHVVQSRQAA